MSFTARLGADVTTVEAGASVPLSVEIANRSDERDQFEMELEGLDPEWTAVPVPTFFVDAREVQTEKIFFKPPRASESLAGNYPFVLKIRSLVNGEVRSVQGIIEIKPFHHLSAEINPKRGSVSPTRRQEDFDLTVMNLGNTEHTLQLVGNDPDDECAFAFEPEQVTLSPGQQKDVYVGVNLSAQKPFSGSRLYSFSISARSIESPSLVCSAQAQLERKPLMAPTMLAFLSFLLIVGIGWWMLMPKPPTLTMLSVEPNPVLVGGKVTVHWQVDALSKVRIKYGTHEEVFPWNSEYSFTADTAGKLVIQAVAVRDGVESAPKTVELDVQTAPPPPQPEIVKFSISPKTLKKGENAIVTYEFNSAVTKATLYPIQLPLDVNGNSVTFATPNVTEPFVVFTLVAEAAGNPKPAKKTLKVAVVESSLASIVKFDAYPKEVLDTDGRVTLTWQLSGAERAEIAQRAVSPTPGVPKPQDSAVDPNLGSQEFTISQTTEFTLTAYDKAGRTVTKKIVVKVTRAAPPEEPPGPAPTDGGVTR